jgi:hypothetical protein
MLFHPLAALVLTASVAMVQAPIPTPIKDARYLPCRVDAPTNLIFPSTTKITSAVSNNDAVQVAFKAGESMMQVTAKPAADGSRLVIKAADGSTYTYTYTYEINHEVPNGEDCGAINFSVWPLNDDQIKTDFEGELLQTIAAAPVKHYTVTYSSRKPTFTAKPIVGFRLLYVTV